ncbi:MAG: hypothetical protein ACRCXM_09015 [Beijerinckiaceae bacterium]
MRFERIHEPDEPLEHLITPYFRFETLENVPQSEIKGEAVMETVEVVELRFAGDKNYAPVLPALSMYRMDGHHVVTYAERFAKQYAEFQQGATQHASGTPLEKLSQYGISGAQLSLCRALKIYSIEALHGLDGPNLKSLGMNQNALKDMARRYMDDRATGGAMAAELASLRAELEAMKNPIPKDAVADAEVLPDGYEAMTDVDLKDAIEAKVGARPRGNPSRETLVRMLNEAGA